MRDCGSAIVLIGYAPDFTKNHKNQPPLTTTHKKKMTTSTIRKFSGTIATLSLLALCATLALPQASAQQGGVAVLDIDKVAIEVGVEDEVKAALKAIEDNLNTQLKSIQTDLQARFDNMRAQVGTQPTQEQAQQLANINGQLTQQLTQSRAQAQSQLNSKQFELVTAFRDQVKPVALEIAKSKGLAVVVTPDQSLLVWDDAVDITVEVTKKMKSILPERKAAAPAPAADRPEGAATTATPATTAPAATEQ